MSTTKQDLDRQIDALHKEGIGAQRIYVDKTSKATTKRPRLHAALDQAQKGDVIVAHTLDRLGCTVRDTLNLIHDLAKHGVGVRNLTDPIRVDSSDPEDPMSQLAVVMLALFDQMERTYAIERAAHARAVATAKGRRVGRPSVADPTKLACEFSISRETLYQYLRPSTGEPADDESPAELNTDRSVTGES
ncbi:recombinase family protein [Citricoccus sp.]|uniref:recombinase family protein n=1 Tax=Citricoccus sp. TaxID=1978372 RepID=UPI0037C12AA5